MRLTRGGIDGVEVGNVEQGIEKNVAYRFRLLDLARALENDDFGRRVLLGRTEVAIDFFEIWSRIQSEWLAVDSSEI